MSLTEYGRFYKNIGYIKDNFPNSSIYPTFIISTIDLSNHVIFQYKLFRWHNQVIMYNIKYYLLLTTTLRVNVYPSTLTVVI